MDKKTARELLQNYIDNQYQKYGKFTLPIYDVVVYTVEEDKKRDDYTWRYLVRVAYGK